MPLPVEAYNRGEAQLEEPNSPASLSFPKELLRLCEALQQRATQPGLLGPSEPEQRRLVRRALETGEPFPPVLPPAAIFQSLLAFLDSMPEAIVPAPVYQAWVDKGTYVCHYVDCTLALYLAAIPPMSEDLSAGLTPITCHAFTADLPQWPPYRSVFLYLLSLMHLLLHSAPDLDLHALAASFAPALIRAEPRERRPAFLAIFLTLPS
jgi:hypothetical protein